MYWIINEQYQDQLKISTCRSTSTQLQGEKDKQMVISVQTDNKGNH